MITDQTPTELRQPLVEVLTGGNHLATILLSRLPEIPSYRLPVTEKCLLDGDTWDVWIAWRAIMRLRDAMQEQGLYE